MKAGFMPRRKVAWISLCFVFLFACGADPRVIISPKSGSGFAVTVEIADTASKREMGLQYRNDLKESQGMLFLFPADSVLTFWMKNTPIPLDMIFIGADMKIAGIVENATPFTLSPRSIGIPSRYVLEINGGLAKKYGIEKGDAVRFEGVSQTAQ